MIASELKTLRSAVRLRRLSALAVFACASSVALNAQTVDRTPATLVSSVDAPKLDLASRAAVDYSSSSSSVATPVDASSTSLLAGVAGDSLQPPPRRRYGRPRYNDSSHNPDGSNKYAFVAGAGFTAPLGNTYHYLNTDYGFQVGAGRNLDKNFAVMFQFDYDHFGFNGRTLYNQSLIYDPTNQYGTIGSLDGKSHVWSLTVNPVFNFYTSGNVGAYVVGGVGFYHKTANFTVPATGTYCDYYYGCYQYQANQTIDKYTSNAPGFNGGLGMTFKPSRFAGERFYVEGRYVFMDNSQKFGYTVKNIGTAPITATNFYPANSNRTTYTVFKAGIRF